MNPLQHIIERFQSFYQEDNVDQKDDVYWAAKWHEFLDKEGLKTFLPYIFKTGCLYYRLWEVYKLKGNLSFNQAEVLSGNVGWGEMDWLDTAINQPQFVGKLANGATLQQFLDCITQQCSDDDYNSLFQTAEYWVDYWGYDEEDAVQLVKEMNEMKT